MKRIYYVYKIVNKETKEFYIGYRSTRGNPEKDLGVRYFTSGVLKQHFKDNVDSYDKHILYSGENERKAFWNEQQFIMQSFGNVLCRNRHYSVRVKSQTVESLTKNSKVKESDYKKRIWSDQHGKFVDMPMDEYKKLVSMEKMVNGYGGKAKKVII
jgi:hypothetical protein